MTDTPTPRVTDDKIIDRVLLKLAGTPMGMSLEEWGALSNDLTEVAISTREKDATIAELRAEVERLNDVIRNGIKNIGEMRRELSDSVPRSRYDVVCGEVVAARKKRDEVCDKAEWIVRDLEKRSGLRAEWPPEGLAHPAEAEREAAESALATANAREFARAALKEISADRKPVKIDLSKEWCMKMAEREGNHEIGAGSLADQTDRQRAEAKARMLLHDYDKGLCAWTSVADALLSFRREGYEAGREDAADSARKLADEYTFSTEGVGWVYEDYIAAATWRGLLKAEAVIRALKPKES